MHNFLSSTNVGIDVLCGSRLFNVMKAVKKAADLNCLLLLPYSSQLDATQIAGITCCTVTVIW